MEAQTRRRARTAVVASVLAISLVVVGAISTTAAVVAHRRAPHTNSTFVGVSRVGQRDAVRRYIAALRSKRPSAVSHAATVPDDLSAAATIRTAIARYGAAATGRSVVTFEPSGSPLENAQVVITYPGTGLRDVVVVDDVSGDRVYLQSGSYRDCASCRVGSQ